jgi:hypothetical protein
MERHYRIRALVVGLLTTVVMSACGDDSPSDPDPATLAIPTVAIASATEGQLYSAVLGVTGGEAPYTWSVASGELPEGIALTAATGELAGTPTGLGTTFVVQVASGDGQTATREFALDVLFTWDLAQEWSDVTNPFGPWEVLEDADQPFTTSQADFWGDATNQAAWAAAPFDETAHVPFWMKVSVENPSLDGFATIGTVVAHTAEPARTGSDQTSLTWTSPFDGGVTIGGGIWVRQDFDRPQLWSLHLNATEFTSGGLSQGDGFSQATPFLFSTGSGGAAAVNFPVSAGDVVELRLVRDAPGPADPGDVVGVRLGIGLLTQQGS